ncbi:MAG: hypothetical protein KME16_10775 [Scytolyngbya sp. HA4215-MV1]|jgi:cytoskeletal protein RodZ|nr:hypothetical protein [Scytolyngbya sp. HA4215-MV1]
MPSQEFSNTLTDPLSAHVGHAPQSQPYQAESVDAPEVLPDSSSTLVETYADSLMDELFGDVEQILQRGVKLPAEPVRAEPPTSSTFNIPQLVFSSSLLSRPNDPEAISEAPIVVPDSVVDKHRKSQRSLDRLLLVAGFASILLTALAWAVLQQRATPPSTTPVATALAPQQQADSQFMNYLQRSLDTLSQRKSSPSPTGVAAVPPGTLPKVDVKGSPVPATNSAKPTASPQRIYIPIFGSPKNMGNGAAPASVVVVPANPNQTQPLTPAEPLVQRTLVGVLELGDRSAALFELNGVTQRYQVGESIGSSGWTLVDISKNQAVIRRNGEVRSIFVGQKL